VKSQPTVALAIALSLVGACGPPSAGSSSSTTPPVTTLRSLTYYPDCDAARDAGATPLRRGDPGYRPPLDRDGDGVACGDDGDS
jgi:hypothetical protein